MTLLRRQRLRSRKLGSTDVLIGVLFGILLLSSAEPARSAAAQAPDGGPRTTFVFARYGTGSSRALYAGYGAGSWQAILAVIENPRSDYREALIGLAKGFTLAPRQSVIVALAVADASDSRYGQLYIVPSLSAAPLALSATVEIYAPLERRGAFQYYLNPLSLHVAVASHVEVGATYVLNGQVGTGTGHGIGPSLRLAVPHGSLTLDWIRGITAYRNDTRLSFQTSL